MTDKEVITKILEKANIEYDFYDNDSNVMYVERGYAGFTSCFTFDEDGNLKNVEAGE